MGFIFFSKISYNFIILYKDNNYKIILIKNRRQNLLPSVLL